MVATIDASIPPTVPVNVGEASFAYEEEAAIQTGSDSVFTYARDVDAEIVRYVAVDEAIVRYVAVEDAVVRYEDEAVIQIGSVSVYAVKYPAGFEAK